MGLTIDKAKKLATKKVPQAYKEHKSELNECIKELMKQNTMPDDVKENIQKYLNYQNSINETTDNVDELIGLIKCIEDVKSIKNAYVYDKHKASASQKLNNILDTVTNDKVELYNEQYLKIDEIPTPLKVKTKDDVKDKITGISSNLVLEAKKNDSNIAAFRQEIDTSNQRAKKLYKIVNQFKKGTVEYNKYGQELLEVHKEIKKFENRLAKATANKNDIKDVAAAIESLEEFVGIVDVTDLEKLINPLIKNYSKIFDGVFLGKFKIAYSKATARYNEQRDHISDLNQHLESETIEMTNNIESVLAQYDNPDEEQVVEEVETSDSLDDILKQYE